MNKYLMGDREDKKEQLFDYNRNHLSWSQKRELNKSIRKDEKILDANWKFARKIIYPAIEQVSATDTATLKNIVSSIDEKNLLDFHCFSQKHIKTLYAKLNKNEEMKNDKMTSILGSISNSFDNEQERSF